MINEFKDIKDNINRLVHYEIPVLRDDMTDVALRPTGNMSSLCASMICVIVSLGTLAIL